MLESAGFGQVNEFNRAVFIGITGLIAFLIQHLNTLKNFCPAFVLVMVNINIRLVIDFFVHMRSSGATDAIQA